MDMMSSSRGIPKKFGGSGGDRGSLQGSGWRVMMQLWMIQ